jgi:hypothetical protein
MLKEKRTLIDASKETGIEVNVDVFYEKCKM